MLIYNVTAHVETSIEKAWLEWMKTEHLPEMQATNKFTQTKIYKIITADELGGVSYAVQYHCDNQEKYQAYLNEDAPRLRKKARDEFGDKVLFFRTELQLIHHLQ